MVAATRVYEYGTGLVAGPLVACTAASGGTRISGSANIFSITVMNISGNSPVWIGGNGLGTSPISGTGLILYGGASIDLRVDNSADVFVCAEASGQNVSWCGVLR